MPTKMLDVNVASDYRAIIKLFNIGDSERNYKILQELIENGSITGIIKDRYDFNQEFSQDDLITFLYSMGFITIRQELFCGVFEFEIPNYAIKLNLSFFHSFALIGSKDGGGVCGDLKIDRKFSGKTL